MEVRNQVRDAFTRIKLHHLAYLLGKGHPTNEVSDALRDRSGCVAVRQKLDHLCVMLKICKSGFSSGDQKKAPCRPSVLYRGDVKDDLLLVACDKILFYFYPLEKSTGRPRGAFPWGIQFKAIAFGKDFPAEPPLGCFKYQRPGVEALQV